MKLQKNKTLNLKKSGYVILSLVFCLGFVLLVAPKKSQAEDNKGLEDNIASLKAKIRNSETKNPRDIEKLYKFENELEKKRYLQRQGSRAQ